MSLSTPFIRRPVATILLTFGVAAAGALAFFELPVAPLPQVDFPTISVRAQLPGGSPAVVATTVATPLERHLGQIADVTEMTTRGRDTCHGSFVDGYPCVRVGRVRSEPPSRSVGRLPLGWSKSILVPETHRSCRGLWSPWDAVVLR
jgi:hypothetical protein